MFYENQLAVFTIFIILFCDRCTKGELRTHTRGFSTVFSRPNTSLPYLRWYQRKTGSAVIAIVSDMLVARASGAIPHIHEYTITLLNDLLRASFALI
jgi:hypothetical protein